MNRILSLLLAAAFGLSLVGCNASASTGDPASSTVSQTASPAASSQDTASFTFDNNGIQAAGDSSCFEIDGTALTITAPGSYLLSGSCENGSIKVKKGVTDVTLRLNGLTLSSADTAPLLCAKSTGVTVEAVAGTVNTLSDSARNNDDNFPDNDLAENAVIKCKDGSQIVLCGSGTLRLTANGKNGIKSGSDLDGRAASLTIRELTLAIDAPVNDAVNAEQLLCVESGDLTLFAADDALHSDLTLTVGAEGTAGPRITITGCEEGIEGADLTIASGEISITAEDDCLNAANSDLGSYPFSMTITGGNITAFSASGDGFDSNGDLTITGGTIQVWTANRADNQPLDADGTISITGGTVLAAGGSSGMGLTLITEQNCITYGSSSGPEMEQTDKRHGDFQAPDEPQRPESGEALSAPPEPPQGFDAQPPMQDGEAAPPELPFRQDGSTPPELPQGMPGAGGELLLTADSTFSVTDAVGRELLSGTAPCDTGYFFFCSSDLETGSLYTLAQNGTAVNSVQAESGSISSAHSGPGRF